MTSAEPKHQKVPTTPTAIWHFVIWPLAVTGAILLTWSYSLAATRQEADQTHYAVFWAGMLLLTVPTIAVCCSRQAAPRMRLAWLLAYGVFTFLPKLLRDPSTPLFHDEVAHWRQTVNLVASGKPFQPDPLIGIISRYPGLHATVASVSATTGLNVWQSAQLLLVLAHVIALLGAYVLGEATLGSARAGAVVALFYSFNSSYLYFDTELGYESLAIPFFLWSLACVAKLHRAHDRKERIAWAAAAAVLGCAVAPIHPLTALILVLALSLVSAATLISRLRGNTLPGTAAPTLVVTGAVAVAIVLWITAVAPGTVSYLSPYFGGGIGQLSGLFYGSGGGRTLFSASTEPAYEQGAAFLCPAITAVLAFAAIANTWHKRKKPDRPRWGPMRLGLALFGLIYFPSLPFILVSTSAEGARRSWGFTYVALGVLITPTVLALVDSRRWRSIALQRAARTAAIVGACILLVGNTSAGLDEDYRFPGPFVYGSDTRSISTELIETADWFDQHIGNGELVVTDRYTGLEFVRDANAWTAAPSPGFPAYDLYYDVGKPSPDLIAELSTSHYAYFIVDRRMALQLPAIGVYFEPDEPFAYASADPITTAALTQYEQYPWTTLIYQSDDYSIYRFDFDAVGAVVSGGPR